MLPVPLLAVCCVELARLASPLIVAVRNMYAIALYFVPGVSLVVL